MRQPGGGAKLCQSGSKLAVQKGCTVLLSAASFNPSTRQKHIILLDITYTDDLKVAERYQQKLDHHELYLDHLRGLGWRAKLYPIVLTHSGCATLSLRTLLKTDCGFTDTTVDTLLKLLQKHTFNYNSSLKYTRYKFKQKLRSNLLPPVGIG